MNRRKFFKRSSLFTLGTTLLHPNLAFPKTPSKNTSSKNKKAKNIIIIVSDGMSTGTLNMADVYLDRKFGKGSKWLQLYKDGCVNRALMDMASATSIVTDSAAASSSWGGGFRVGSGSLNVGLKGEEYIPLWQKFKTSGKKAGCVTTVPITHATPAGFCINQKSRHNQEDIALKYLDQKFDVLMGGGSTYFSPSKRKDKRNLFEEFKNAGYQVFKNRVQMLNHKRANSPILGLFDEGALPYSLDREHDELLMEKVPTLAEMTQKAIEVMKDNPKGFVLQVEAGKVDWAAHGNDIGGLLNDQIAHDHAIEVAIDFAEKDRETLVIITTDHGNANPGIIYGDMANGNFDSLQRYRHTNEWILNGIGANTKVDQIKERIHYATNIELTDREAQMLSSHYSNLHKENELYNPRHLPFQQLAQIQKNHNSVGWISMQHSADYVELAMYGPGSHLLKPFIKNTDLHYIMLEAAEVANSF